MIIPMIIGKIIMIDVRLKLFKNDKFSESG